MKKAKFFRLFFTTFLLILILFSPACKKREAKKEEIIKIGAILPLTGHLAVFGEEIKNSINLANEEIASKANNKILVLYEDCKGESKETVNAYNKLVKVDEVKVVISFTTPLIEPLIPLATRDNVLLIALTIYSGVVENPVTIRIFYDVATESEKLAIYASKLGLKNIVLIRSNDSASEYQVEKYLKNMLENIGISIIKDITYQVREKDFKRIITPLPKEVDGIIILGFGIDFPGVLKELKKYDYLKNKHILGGVGFWEVPQDCPPTLLEGITFAAPQYLPYLFQTEFSQKYYNKYNKQPYYISPYVYDNLNILFKVLKKSNFELKDGRMLKQEIISLRTYSGISGLINILDNGDSRVPISLVVYDKERKIKVLD